MSSGNRVRRVASKSCEVTSHVGLITRAWRVDGKTTTLVFPLRTVPFVVLAGECYGEVECQARVTVEAVKVAVAVIVVSKGSAAWKTWRADDDDATFWATKMSLEAKVRKMLRADALWQVCGVLHEKHFLSMLLFFSVGMFQLG